MTPVLAHPQLQAALWPLTVEAYHALGQMGLIPKKTELLHGLVYHKMPKSPLHSLLLIRLIRLLQARLPTGYFLRSEQPLTFVDSEPEPDISIVRGSEEDYPDRHPATADLIIEVCVSSHEYDREKLRAYATASVKEVWLVLGPERQVELFRRPEGGRFADTRVITADAPLTSDSLPAVGFALNELFRS